MNLGKLFEMQKVLDERIYDRFPELRGQNNLDWKILALQVELGECANEWRGFKRWSKDQEPNGYATYECEKCKGGGSRISFAGTENQQEEFCSNCDGEGELKRNPLLEEYVDCLHFIISIALESGYEEEFGTVIKSSDVDSNVRVEVTEQFKWLFRTSTDIALLDTYINNHIRMFLLELLALGRMLRLTWDQVEQAYTDKNKVNHERQGNGY